MRITTSSGLNLSAADSALGGAGQDGLDAILSAPLHVIIAAKLLARGKKQPGYAFIPADIYRHRIQVIDRLMIGALYHEGKPSLVRSFLISIIRRYYYQLVNDLQLFEYLGINLVGAVAVSRKEQEANEQA